MNRYQQNKEYFRNYNRAYQRIWNKTDKAKATRKRLMESRRAIVLAAKNAPCMDCKISYPPCVMDFDHVRGEKKFELAYFWTHSAKRIEEELLKCDLVCANCHRIRTEDRRVRVGNSK